MADTTDNVVHTQLTTRIPKELHRAVKMHTTRTDQSVMGFVVKALVAQLGQERVASAKAKK